MRKLCAAIPGLVLVGTILLACSASDQTATLIGGGSGSSNGGSSGTTGASGASGTPGSSGDTQGGASGQAGGGTSGGGAGGMSGASGADVGGGGSGTGGASGGGTSGSSGMSGMSGMSGAPSLMDVAAPLDGQMLLGPCLRNTQASVCATVNGQCPAANPADRALSGVLTTDRMITLNGAAGTLYNITLHIQGEVESKQYPGGRDQNNTLQSPRADGFCTGGTPTTADAYNVYMIRVTNPGSTTRTDYFLNSLQAPGVSNHTTYGIDYMATIQAQGGATLRLVAADSNCSMIKNCGPIVNDGNSCPAPIILSGIETQAVTLNPTFNFNAEYNGQWVVMTVKDVSLAP